MTDLATLIILIIMVALLTGYAIGTWHAFKELDRFEQESENLHREYQYDKPSPLYYNREGTVTEYYEKY